MLIMANLRRIFRFLIFQTKEFLIRYVSFVDPYNCDVAKLSHMPLCVSITTRHDYYTSFVHVYRTLRLGLGEGLDISFTHY